jgi:hypothetical protein
MNLSSLNSMPKMKTNLFSKQMLRLLLGLSLLITWQIEMAKAGEPIHSDCPVEIEMELSDTQTHVAEPIELVITVTSPTGITVELPPLEDHIGPFDVIGHHDVNDIPTQNKRRWQRRIKLESLMPGELKIPAIEIAYVDRRDNSITTGIASTRPQLVSVVSNFEGPTNPQQLRDIKSVVFVPMEFKPDGHRLTAATFIASFMLALGLTAVLFAKRKKDVPARQQILTRLDTLLTQSKQNSIGNDQALIQLSKIARDFSKFEYQISAPELTTNDFLYRASLDPRLSSELKNLLSDILTQADMIKFARLEEVETNLQSSVEQLTEIVKQADRNRPQLEPRSNNPNISLDLDRQSSKRKTE